MPAGWVAAAIVVGAAVTSHATKKAAEQSADASRRAQDMQLTEEERARRDSAPWRESGKRSLAELNRMQGLAYRDYSKEPDQFGDYSLVKPGDAGYKKYNLENTPGYQFRLDEGLKALQRSSLAGSVSGNTYKGLVEYGQNKASEEYGNQYNRLANLANQGQIATAESGRLGAQSTALRGKYEQTAGDTRAAGTLAQGQIWGDAIGSLGSLAGGGGGATMSKGSGGNFANYYSQDRVAPGGSFGSNPYQGAGGYGDNWTDY